MRHVGEPVEVAAPWSSFWRKRGRVTQTQPYLMVHVEGERVPMRFGEGEVFSLESSKHVGGAE